jgi:two-component system LytT family response regulator
MPDALRVVLVDDEAPARSILREYLGAHHGVEIVGECANGFEAVKTISEQRPDLVFLDVQMPKLDGFEVLELLEPRPAVIFCTAYDEYALKAFEVHAVDYLLKPFGRERLTEALARARARLDAGAARAGEEASRSTEPGGADPAAGAPGVVTGTTAAGPAGAGASALARAARGPDRYVERIVVRDGAQVHVLPVERVDWIEAQDDYVAIHSGGRAHLKHQTLADLAEGLDPSRFVRVHRSYVANVERIARIELLAKDQRVAVLHDGRQLPVSRSGQERLRELLG